jgi:hypothetical protein
MHTYFTLIELETEEWPWETVFELAENEKWKKYFEAQSTVVSWNLMNRWAMTNIRAEMAVDFVSCEGNVY